MEIIAGFSEAVVTSTGKVVIGNNVMLGENSSSPDMLITWDVAPNIDTYPVYLSTDPYAEFSSGWFLEASGLLDPNWTNANTAELKKFYVIVGVNSEK